MACLVRGPTPARAAYAERASFLRSYTGQMTVFRGEAGNLVEQQEPLRSASHPGQFSTKNSGSTDVDGDGNGDISYIRSGVYHYSTKPTAAGRFSPTRTAEFSNVARDVSQDGVIDGEELTRSHQASGIQLHAGGDSAPSSAGCQTLPPIEFERFREAILDANSAGYGDFTYILVRRPNDRFGNNPF